MHIFNNYLQYQRRYFFNEGITRVHLQRSEHKHIYAAYFDFNE